MIEFLRAAAGISLGETFKYMRGTACIGLGTTIKYLRGAAGIGLGTTIKHLRRTTSVAANNCLGTTVSYLVNQNAGAGNNWAKAHIHKSWARIQMTPPCSVAGYEVNSEPHTGARSSVRLCVGPEFSRCAHRNRLPHFRTATGHQKLLRYFFCERHREVVSPIGAAAILRNVLNKTKA
jgi:hypothetical protein